jgi:hypothetical protein
MLCSAGKSLAIGSLYLLFINFFRILRLEKNRATFPGNPAVSSHFGDPWLSVPASRRVWLFLKLQDMRTFGEMSINNLQFISFHLVEVNGE